MEIGIEFEFEFEFETELELELKFETDVLVLDGRGKNEPLVWHTNDTSTTKPTIRLHLFILYLYR